MRLIPRIHLSTAIILMFVAGALYWINSASYIETVLLRNDIPPERLKGLFCGTGSVVVCFGYGWPQYAVFLTPTRNEFHSIHYSNLAIDILVAITILALTAFLSEYLTARLTRPRQRA